MGKKMVAKIDFNEEIKKLPFCKMAGKGLDRRRYFWCTEPTGDYERDCQTGKRYAELALSCMKLPDAPAHSFLGWCVEDMVQEKDNGNDGIKVGFLNAIGTAAAASNLNLVEYHGQRKMRTEKGLRLWAAAAASNLDLIEYYKQHKIRIEKGLHLLAQSKKQQKKAA
ncbi:MAG: hypothetical protein A2W27_11040 [Deltaproteobacteria bacterium RBG_16_44_11]|nr:MAG: hypothetical protein A2W27_11040 [Deltaproteobacteria bacterium RBG_16_44_11]